MWISEMAKWMAANRGKIAQGSAFVLTIVFYVGAFPPYDFPEAGFVVLIPFLIWFRMGPTFKQVAWTGLLTGWVAWFILIFWLRHVTWMGLTLLSGVVGLHFMLWCLGTFWLSKRLLGKGLWMGLPFAIGTSALWVALEHIRGWVFTGFPWLPLSASQWSRPIMLQSATFWGAWGISFGLVLLNAGVAAYMLRIVRYSRTRTKTFCPEFYLALIVFVSMTFLQTRHISGQDREPLFRAAAMQPAIPQNEKWDASLSKEILDQIEKNTLLLAPMKPDVIFWPEATLPYPIKGDIAMRAWVERLATEVDTPIFAGALVAESDEVWYNGVYLIRSKWGMYPEYYAKRHLVPFGEYIPLRSLWPWIEKIVPIEGDLYPGQGVSLLPLSMPNRTINIGTLICYEDVFPGLARKSTLEGAGMLFVATNSAWYGQSAASFQHMAHSVLRAVENRRVVFRVGNDGWSGWIDEYGNVRDELLDEDGKIWFSGGTTWKVDRDKRWKGRETFYTQKGDWFVAVCWSALLIAGLIAVRYKVALRDQP